MVTPGSSRLLVLGLDGATFAVLDPLLAAGRCPNLAALAARGVKAPLRSTLPPMTAAAWAAFLTGKGPGGSGVASFRKLDLSRYSAYDPEMVTSRDLAGANWLEHLSRLGVPVSSVGLPMTWPPFRVSGVLVSGFPRPPSHEAPVLPPTLGRRWGRWDRPADASSRHLPEVRRPAACAAWDRRHADVSLDLLGSRDDRVHVCVFSGTDHMAHLFWGPRGGAGPFAGALDEHYATVDGLCGELIAAAGPGATVLVVSDHGFGPAESHEVHVDRFLASAGWLAVRAERRDPVGGFVAEFRRRLPKGLWKRWRDRLPGGLKTRLHDRAAERDRVDWARTRAYRVGLYQGYEGVHLNVRGRQPHGVVEPGEAFWRERERLIGDFRAARLPDGSPLVAAVWPGEAAWPGSRSGALPDLLVKLREGHRGGRGLPPGPLVTDVPADELARVSGTHRDDGILIAAGPDIRPAVSLADPGIVDVAPTLLMLLGLPIPSDLEGRPWTEALTDEAASRPRPRPGPPLGSPGEALGTPPAPPAETDRAAVEERLRALGYLR